MNITDNHIEGRCENYYRISSQIALLDNEYLGSLFAASESSTGWGRNHTIDIGDSKVFVKRVPVTDSEHANLFTTRNLHDLPTYYNYGVGSAGFGVFRELVAHIKTTNWVLNGEIENFPLMYHYRIVPSPVNPQVSIWSAMKGISSTGEAMRTSAGICWIAAMPAAN